MPIEINQETKRSYDLNTKFVNQFLKNLPLPDPMPRVPPVIIATGRLFVAIFFN